MSNLAERLRARLAETGLKQNELAKRAGVRPPSVAQWLNGRTKNIKGMALNNAAAALQVNPLWLAEGVGPKLPTAPPEPARSAQEPTPTYEAPAVATALQILRALPEAAQVEALAYLQYLAQKHGAFSPSKRVAVSHRKKAA